MRAAPARARPADGGARVANVLGRRMENESVHEATADDLDALPVVGSGSWAWGGDCRGRAGHDCAQSGEGATSIHDGDPKRARMGRSVQIGRWILSRIEACVPRTPSVASSTE